MRKRHSKTSSEHATAVSNEDKEIKYLTGSPSVRNFVSMDSPSEYRFDVMTPRTYIFGALIILLGALGIFMMVLESRAYPLLTIFFYSVASNAAIAIFPHEPVLIWFGRFVNLWVLSTVATLGTVLAMYLDYKFFGPLLNLSYSAKYRSKKGYQKASGWFHRMPFVIIVAASFLPIPFYPIKFMAVSARYPLSKFLAAIALGRFPRYYLLGLLGLIFQVPTWILIVIFFAMLLALYYKKIWNWTKWPFVKFYMALFGPGRKTFDKQAN